MKVLFICNQGKNRSRTASEIFKDKFKTKFAGLYAEAPVSEREISWADIIFVMEDWQRSELGKRFPGLYLKKQIISLDIPDIYFFNQPELVELLKRKMDEAILTIH